MLGPLVFEPPYYTIDETISNDSAGDQTTGVTFTFLEAAEIYLLTMQSNDAVPNVVEADLLNVSGIAVEKLILDTPAQNDLLRMSQRVISEQAASTPNVVGAPKMPLVVPASFQIRLRAINLATTNTLRIWMIAHVYSGKPSRAVIGASATQTINEGDTVG